MLIFQLLVFDCISRVNNIPFFINSEWIFCDQIIYVFISPHPSALLNFLSSLKPKHDELG